MSKSWHKQIAEGTGNKVTGASTLIQDKLDVTKKLRANLFNWRGQFTPQFVDYILDNFAQPNHTVVDPFSGSGTVLQECAMKDMSCYGYEINPAAYAMSKFFTFANLPISERQILLCSFEERLLQTTAAFRNMPLLQDKIPFRDRYKTLLDFSKELFSGISNKQEKILAINALLIAESRNRPDLPSTIFQAFEYLRKATLSLPHAERVISANLSDARLVHKRCPVKAEVLFTSPPYINVFNYHQNHRAILEAIGWNILKVAQSEIGSNRKNRGNRFRTVIQYCLDMEQALVSFWHCLKPHGVIILVVGRESNVRKIPFFNGAIIKDIMTNLGGFTAVANYERKFTNRFGLKIKEDIIISRKADRVSSQSHARQVALRHLESVSRKAAGDAKMDIHDAIKEVNEIESSPLLMTKEIFSHA